MKLQRIRTHLMRGTLIVATLALAGCATTQGDMSRHNSNAEGSPKGKENEVSAVVLDEKPSRDLVRAEEKKEKKMTREERRKLVKFYKEENAVS